MIKKAKIISDGGAIQNPGPAGIGVIIKIENKKEVVKTYSKYIGEATNNEAEYRALIFGLSELKKILGKKIAKMTEVECFSDSKLLVSQLNGKYKIKEERLFPLFIQIWNLKTDFKNVKFIYLEREGNLADRLVKEALKLRPQNHLF